MRRSPPLWSHAILAGQRPPHRRPIDEFRSAAAVQEPTTSHAKLLARRVFSAGFPKTLAFLGGGQKLLAILTIYARPRVVLVMSVLRLGPGIGRLAPGLTKQYRIGFPENIHLPSAGSASLHRPNRNTANARDSGIGLLFCLSSKDDVPGAVAPPAATVGSMDETLFWTTKSKGGPLTREAGQ